MKRLRELRIQRNLKREDIAKVLNVTTATVSNYENGTRNPGIAELITLANFFDVSVDYLIGRISVLKSPKEYQTIRYSIERTIKVPKSLTDGEIDLIIKEKAKGCQYRWYKNSILQKKY